MKLLVKFPTRNRPLKFKQVFLKYQHMRCKRHNVQFLISMDEDDPKMNNPEIRRFLDLQGNAKYIYGKSDGKIHAVNRDMDQAGEFDVLLLASDDMIPEAVDYDDIIFHDMKRHFPDLDGVLHYHDGRQGERINTLCIMGKKYYERFKYIYNPAYTSVYADNEFTEVSRRLNKAVFKPITIIKHGWINYIGVDELYLRNENAELYEKDKKVFEERLSKNFELETLNAG